jgi:hypothetical protein
MAMGCRKAARCCPIGLLSSGRDRRASRRARYHLTAARRYANTGTHAIPVGFLPYLRQIRKERRAAARRIGTTRTITTGPPESAAVGIAGSAHRDDYQPAAEHQRGADCRA